MMINIRRRKNAEALVKLKFSEIEEKNANLEKAHRSISSLLEEMETKNENLSELNRQLDRARVLAEESDKLKTTFLHNMSHEIRTPMNAIIGFSSLLLDENSIEKKRNYIDIIEANSRNLLVLINNILDLSKMQTSRIELYPAPCRLPELLDRMVQSFVPECKDKGLGIRLTKTDLPADLIIHADEVKLEQVLNNLLSNAVKYTREGSIDMGVRRLPSEILFYVKDSGIGIPSCTGEKIFEQFYRIEDTSLEVYRGTGLGLAICRSLVSLWNGKIWYESQQGTGTTFFFTLPYAVLPAQTNSNNRGKDTVHDWSGRCFIIAEDEDSNFQLLKSYLDPTGAELLHARTGVEAIHLAMQRPVDLVLMDIKMPVLNGKDALKQMREKKLSLPVIAQTAYAFTDEVDQLLKCGFNAILTKPIQKSTLFDQIAQNLQNPGKDPIK
jgi:signal transduction histidine kinase/CheY-like chemotaxis protein